MPVPTVLLATSFEYNLEKMINMVTLPSGAKTSQRYQQGSPVDKRSIFLCKFNVFLCNL